MSKKKVKYNSTIVFFDWKNGFGFVVVDSTGEEVYLHESVVRCSGIKKGTQLKDRKAKSKISSGERATVSEICIF